MADPASPDSGSIKAVEGATGAQQAAGNPDAKPAEGAIDAQQAPAQKDGQPGEQKQPAADAAPILKAPEKYEFKPPEGQQYDAAVLDKFSTIARELDLSQDQASKLMGEMGSTLQAQTAAAVQAVRTQWAESTKSDKEIGGDKLAENLGIAKTALEKFATPEFTTYLNETGLGNHPDMVKLLVRVGKTISEDRTPMGRGGVGEAAPAQKSLGDTLFGAKS